MTLSCSEPVDVLMAYRDHSEYELEYEVTTTALKSNNDSKVGRGTISLKDKQKALRPLQGKALSAIKSKPDGSPQDEKNHEPKTRENVDIHDENESSLQFDYTGPDDMVLTQVQLQDPSTGNRIYRSILVETKLHPVFDVTPMDLGSAFVDNNGDLNLVFTGIDFGLYEVVLLKAMISVEWKGKTLKDGRIELQGMTSTGHLVLHGGWIRTILDKDATRRCDLLPDGAGLVEDGGCWKVKVEEAVALNPENSYRVIAQLENAKDSGIKTNKKLLSNSPSKDEKEISDEMKQGRRPPKSRHLAESQKGLRGLQSNAKKILVHGYW